MLSYRHGFHAGNPADVFKHCVLLALLDAMQVKPRGLTLIDTHAGAAGYDLSSDMARKNREFDAGIGRLWARTVPAGPWASYLSAVQAFNPDGNLSRYPGSPWLLRDRLRPQDRLVLCELHPTEQVALRQAFGEDRRVRIQAGDGYQALAKLLPPPSSQALVLIDPPFELKTELEDLARALATALKRFAHGVFLIWYPLIEGRETAPDGLPERLGLGAEQWLDLRVSFAPPQRLGRMSGCGMALINCPFSARDRLQTLTEAWSTLFPA